MASQNPHLENVLARYPHIDRSSLNFPPESAEWTEKDLDAFVYSGGFLKPKKKKYDKSTAVVATPVSTQVDTIPIRGALPPLEKSAWWVNNPNPSAKLRLFCAMGIGSVASTYGTWVSQAIAETYPEIEVCVIEFPGHGTHFEQPLTTLEAAAEALSAEIRRCHFGPEGAARPYAFFGFSMGANIVYRAAQLLGGCQKVYIAGRGAPHIQAPVRDEQAPVIELLHDAAAQNLENMEDVVELLKERVLPLFVGAAQVSSYARLFQTRLAREQGRKDIQRFAMSLVGDCNIGMEANKLPTDFRGEMQFYFSREDETWPVQIKGLYGSEELSELWRPYTTGTYRSEEVAPVSHGALGGFDSPVFPKVCEDLVRLVRSC